MKKISLLLITLFVAGFVFSQEYEKVQELFPDYEHSFKGIKMGEAVDIDGDYAIVGAPAYMNNKGAAYVLKKNGNSWSVIALLKPEKYLGSEKFGFSVAIEGSTIFVGASGHNSKGAVYIFEKPDNGWTDMNETAKVELSASGNNRFGESVAVDDNTLIVGSSSEDSNKGCCYIYEKPVTGWADLDNYTKRLTISDGSSNSYFGQYTKIYDNAIIVSANNQTNSLSKKGIVYVFEKKSGVWQSDYSQKIENTEINSGNFGRAISVTDKYIVIGQYNYNSYSKAVVYTKGDSWETISNTVTIPCPDPGNQNFGCSVYVFGNILGVGANVKFDGSVRTGAVYMFNLNPDGSVTGSHKTIYPTIDKNQMVFGTSLAIDNESLLVGGYNDNTKDYQSGAVHAFVSSDLWNNYNESKIIPLSGYDTAEGKEFGKKVSAYNDVVVATDADGLIVFKKSNEEYTKIATLTSSRGNNNFGASVAIYDNIIIAGAPEEADIDDDYETGVVYVFVKQGEEWTDMTETAILSPVNPDEEDYMYFGYSVAIDNDIIIIGANEYYNTNGDRTGAAFYYKVPESWDNAVVSDMLLPDNLEEYSSFGIDIAAYNGTVVIGSGMMGKVFVYNRTGDSYSTPIEINDPDIENNEYFGYSVDVNENLLVVGEPYIETGEVYVFKKEAEDWNSVTLKAKLLHPEGLIEGYFASEVQVDDNEVLVSVKKLLDGNSLYSNEIYIYNVENSTGEDKRKDAVIQLKNDYSQLMSFVKDGYNIFVGLSGDNKYGSNSGYIGLYNELIDIITATAGSGGSVLPSGEIEFTGSDIEFTISTETGYEIATATLNNIDISGDLIADGENYKYTATGDLADAVLNITFKKRQYEITVAETVNGVVSPNGVVKVYHGTDTTFKFTPNTGYELATVVYKGEDVSGSVLDVSGDIKSFKANDIVSSADLTATFKLKQYTVTINSGKKGKVTRTGDKNITIDDALMFTIIPDPGYRVSSAVLNGKDVLDLITKTESGYKLSFDQIDSDIVLEIEYLAIDYRLNISTSIGGTVTPYGDMTITVEDEQRIEMKPEDNYVVSSLLVNGAESVSAITCTEGVCSYIVKEVVEDTDISIKFSKISTSIDHKNLERGLNIYPNPVKNKLNILASSPIKNGLLTIISATGKVVHEELYSSDNVLDVGNLNSGVYVLRIKEDSNIYETVFVKY
jgi:hypothetical protein